jgi:hypothetical protein
MPKTILIPSSILAFLLVAGASMLTAEQAGASNGEGRIYGTVEMRSGSTYTGFLRWGSQEAYWDDLFHSLKEELPHMDDVDEDEREERGGRRIRILGYRINVNGGDFASSRIFIARFGDIETVEVTGDSDAELTMKSGEVYEVSGYSDDVGGEIHVEDDDAGDIDLKWDRIDMIRFEAAPSSASHDAFRLYGKVSTDVGDFEGYVQWDKEECMSTDELDGDSDDGDISIPMGRIASIERRGRRSSVVVLKDGRKMRLRGSNDVNHDNRGIYVEDARYGRVLIHWDEFDKVSFEENGKSGRGYDDYEKSGALSGTVVDEDGEEFSGRIVFDIDESEGWEMLNGSMNDVEFNIPFQMIEKIEPIGRDGSILSLRSGEELELEEGQDVSESNDGVLVYEDGSRRPTFLGWDEIREIRFDR